MSRSLTDVSLSLSVKTSSLPLLSRDSVAAPALSATRVTAATASAAHIRRDRMHRGTPRPAVYSPATVGCGCAASYARAARSTSASA